MQKEDQGGKRKYIEAYQEHMFELIEFAHNFPDGILHILGAERLIRLKQRKVAVIILPPYILDRINPVLLCKPMP